MTVSPIRELVGTHHHHVDRWPNGGEAVLFHSDEAGRDHFLDHERLDLPFDPCRQAGCVMRRHDDD
jgi:hypothetical protein